MTKDKYFFIIIGNRITHFCIYLPCLCHVMSPSFMSLIAYTKDEGPSITGIHGDSISYGKKELQSKRESNRRKQGKRNCNRKKRNRSRKTMKVTRRKQEVAWENRNKQKD